MLMSITGISMAKDPAFLFYPGDYLRDTQCLSENTQVAYDRIMCEHMRNICITQTQLDFFTKRLTVEEKNELLFILNKVDGGYEIEWVALSIRERISYSESRRKNREGKPKEDMLTYDSHMEGESESDNNSIIKSINVPFEKFWNLYEKKIDRKKCEPKWKRLTDKERTECIENLPAYIQSTPDKKFRRDPETYLNNKSWENEIILPTSKVALNSTLTYDEILKMSEKNPDIWKQYTSVKREG